MGSVGEPIAAEVWHWYNDNIGRGQAHIVDTYWQTESGSHLLTPLAGITQLNQVQLHYHSLELIKILDNHW